MRDVSGSLQPFVEYEYKLTRFLSLTGGIKLANYTMDFLQFADNGKTVGLFDIENAGQEQSVTP